MVNDAFMLVLRILASLSSTAMILSPSPAMYRIYQTKSVGHTSIITLASVLANCHMWMLYGVLYHRFFPVVMTFALGDVIAVYYRYRTERRYVLKVLGVVVGALLSLTIYAMLGANNVTRQLCSEVEYVVGSFGILASMCLYGAGFEKIVHVLKFKTAVFISIDMVVAGSVNQALWLTYLRLNRNWFMFASSVMCTVLCLAQLILYGIYNPNWRKATMLSANGASREIDISVVVDLAPKDPSQLPAKQHQSVPQSPSTRAEPTWSVVKARLDTSYPRIRQHDTPFLVYTIVDELAPIAHTFGAMLVVLDWLLHLEPRTFNVNRLQNTAKQIKGLKRLYKSLNEAIVQLSESKDFTGEILRYFRDVQDHILIVEEDCKKHLDTCKSLVDEFNNIRSAQQSSVSYIISIFAALFLPAQFLTGLYGMNFDVIPELKNPNGYYY